MGKIFIDFAKKQIVVPKECAEKAQNVNTPEGKTMAETTKAYPDFKIVVCRKQSSSEKSKITKEEVNKIFEENKSKLDPNTIKDLEEKKKVKRGFFVYKSAVLKAVENLSK